MNDVEPTVAAGERPFQEARRLLLHGSRPWTDEGWPEVVELVIEGVAVEARARLLPFLRHRATCYLQAVRDNAPWDETCDCGLALAYATPSGDSRDIQS